MNFGKNLQFLRKIRGDMTQENLAEKMNVSRQTVSKWESGAALPEIEKAVELCSLFGCTMDNLFREDMNACGSEYSNLRVETVPPFRYVKYAVISTDPEGDAINRMFSCARDNGIEKPRVIGWDFSHLSQEQINVYNMHGYEAALILPEGIEPPGYEIHSQQAHRYAAIHIEKPFDDPFVTIPNAYGTLYEFMCASGLEQEWKDVLPCFETDGDSMDVYIAVK